MAVLSKLLVLSDEGAGFPTAVLKLPAALSKSAAVPTAALELPLLQANASCANTSVETAVGSRKERTPTKCCICSTGSQGIERPALLPQS